MRVTRVFFKESNAEEISKATAAVKRDYDSWKRLSELWQSESKTPLR